MRLESKKYLFDVLVHGYAEIDDRIVWDILESKLPALLLDIDPLLK